jgi:hypothetical protein
MADKAFGEVNEREESLPKPWSGELPDQGMLEEQNAFLSNDMESMAVDRQSVREFVYGLQDENARLKESNQSMINEVQAATPRQLAALSKLDTEWQRRFDEAISKERADSSAKIEEMAHRFGGDALGWKGQEQMLMKSLSSVTRELDENKGIVEAQNAALKELTADNETLSADLASSEVKIASLQGEVAAFEATHAKRMLANNKKWEGKQRALSESHQAAMKALADAHEETLKSRVETMKKEHDLAIAGYDEERLKVLSEVEAVMGEASEVAYKEVSQAETEKKQLRAEMAVKTKDYAVMERRLREQEDVLKDLEELVNTQKYRLAVLEKERHPHFGGKRGTTGSDNNDDDDEDSDGNGGDGEWKRDDDDDVMLAPVSDGGSDTEDDRGGGNVSVSGVSKVSTARNGKNDGRSKGTARSGGGGSNSKNISKASKTGRKHKFVNNKFVPPPPWTAHDIKLFLRSLGVGDEKVQANVEKAGLTDGDMDGHEGDPARLLAKLGMTRPHEIQTVLARWSAVRALSQTPADYLTECRGVERHAVQEERDKSAVMERELVMLRRENTAILQEMEEVQAAHDEAEAREIAFAEHVSAREDDFAALESRIAAFEDHERGLVTQITELLKERRDLKKEGSAASKRIEELEADMAELKEAHVDHDAAFAETVESMNELVKENGQLVTDAGAWEQSQETVQKQAEQAVHAQWSERLATIRKHLVILFSSEKETNDDLFQGVRNNTSALPQPGGGDKSPGGGKQRVHQLLNALSEVVNIASHASESEELHQGLREKILARVDGYIHASSNGKSVEEDENRSSEGWNATHKMHSEAQRARLAELEHHLETVKKEAAELRHYRTLFDHHTEKRIKEAAARKLQGHAKGFLTSRRQIREEEEQEQHQAASVLQKHHRSLKEKKKQKEEDEKHEAARVLQKHHRSLKEKKQKEEDEKHEAARVLQKHHRSLKEKKKKEEDEKHEAARVLQKHHRSLKEKKTKQKHQILEQALEQERVRCADLMRQCADLERRVRHEEGEREGGGHDGKVSSEEWQDTQHELRQAIAAQSSLETRLAESEEYSKRQSARHSEVLAREKAYRNEVVGRMREHMYRHGTLADWDGRPQSPPSTHPVVITNNCGTSGGGGGIGGDNYPPDGGDGGGNNTNYNQTATSVAGSAVSEIEEEADSVDNDGDDAENEISEQLDEEEEDGSAANNNHNSDSDHDSRRSGGDDNDAVALDYEENGRPSGYGQTHRQQALKEREKESHSSPPRRRNSWSSINNQSRSLVDGGDSMDGVRLPQGYEEGAHAAHVINAQGRPITAAVDEFFYDKNGRGDDGFEPPSPDHHLRRHQQDHDDNGDRRRRQQSGTRGGGSRSKSRSSKQQQQQYQDGQDQRGRDDIVVLRGSDVAPPRVALSIANNNGGDGGGGDVPPPFTFVDMSNEGMTASNLSNASPVGRPFAHHGGGVADTSSLGAASWGVPLITAPPGNSNNNHNTLYAGHSAGVTFTESLVAYAASLLEESEAIGEGVAEREREHELDRMMAMEVNAPWGNNSSNNNNGDREDSNGHNQHHRSSKSSSSNNNRTQQQQQQQQQQQFDRQVRERAQELASDYRIKLARAAEVIATLRDQKGRLKEKLRAAVGMVGELSAACRSMLERVKQQERQEGGGRGHGHGHGAAWYGLAGSAQPSPDAMHQHYQHQQHSKGPIVASSDGIGKPQGLGLGLGLDPIASGGGTGRPHSRRETSPERPTWRYQRTDHQQQRHVEYADEQPAAASSGTGFVIHHHAAGAGAGGVMPLFTPHPTATLSVHHRQQQQWKGFPDNDAASVISSGMYVASGSPILSPRAHTASGSSRRSSSGNGDNNGGNGSNKRSSSSSRRPKQQQHVRLGHGDNNYYYGDGYDDGDDRNDDAANATAMTNAHRFREHALVSAREGDGQTHHNNHQHQQRQQQQHHFQNTGSSRSSSSNNDNNEHSSNPWDEFQSNRQIRGGAGAAPAAPPKQQRHQQQQQQQGLRSQTAPHTDRSSHSSRAGHGSSNRDAVSTAYIKPGRQLVSQR